jgi:hypothetical protein
MLSQRGLENNEMLLLKNKISAKENTNIKMSHLLRDLHKFVTRLTLPLWNFMYLSLQVTLWYYPQALYYPLGVPSQFGT